VREPARWRAWAGNGYKQDIQDKTYKNSPKDHDRVPVRASVPPRTLRKEDEFTR
jgi:hypothetical protein